MHRPRFSIVIPIHESMKYGPFFLWRSIQAIMKQTFTDYEIVIVQQGKMAENTNAGIKRAQGELIKILYLDDYFAHDHALEVISESFRAEDRWLATGCLHQRTQEPTFYEDPHSPHYPEYTEDIHTGNNLIGSPSVITIRNEGHLLFDDNLSYLLDCELYKRYHHTYGPPRLLKDLNVVIGLHKGQTSITMPDDEKALEFDYLKMKYV